MNVKVAVVLATLAACNYKVPSAAEAAPLPMTQSLASGDFNLRVSRTGEMRWNGAPITVEELKTYANQAGKMSPLRLVVQFEGDASNSSRSVVMGALSGSDTCRQARCFEAEWNAPRPPVVY